MNKEDTKKCIEIMQAYVDGKEIERFSFVEKRYRKTDDPLWTWKDINTSYRVKPRIKIIPYKTAAELEDAIINHSSCIKTKSGYGITVFGYGYDILEGKLYIETSNFVKEYLDSKDFEGATFADGAPFGKEVEE